MPIPRGRGRAAPARAPEAGSPAYRRAEALWQAGDLAAARKACEEALTGAPKSVDLLHLAGVVRMQANDFKGAEPFLAKSIQLAPDHPRVVENWARCLERLGRLEEAERFYRKAIRLQPGNDALAMLLADCLGRAGRHDEAEAEVRRALELNPRSAPAWRSAGHAAKRAKRLEEAEHAYRKAVELQGDHAGGWNNLGALLAERDRAAEAVEAFRKACELQPQDASYWSNLGRAFEKLDRFADAEKACLRATELRPQDAFGWLRLAAVRRRLGKTAEAAADLERSGALAPDNGDWWNDYGIELKAQFRYDDAARAFERALALLPAHARPWTNVGNLRKERGDYDGAEEAYRKALEGGYAPARYNLTLLHGLRGKMAEFWEGYEWRFHPENNAPDAVKLPEVPLPMWRGEPLAGKHLLVWIEQGLGDQIQFCRFARLAQEAGARVTWMVAPPLRGLMRTLRWVEAIRGPKEITDYSGFDYWSFALSLPRWFGTRLDTIPAEVPYLAADPRKVEYWRKRLARWQGKRRIGLAWAGNPKHVNDRNRSIPIEALAPLGKVADCVYFSLQKGPREKDLENLPRGLEIVPLGGELKDFTDSAALVSVLDLVISCDSSPVHLAGALARPVWTLLPYTPDWRWLMERSDSPWYPSMRLFRQRKVGDWAGVIEEVCAALAADESGQLRRAVEQHRAGHLGEAVRIYEGVLAADASNFDAEHMLGVIALQQGDVEGAERRIRAALALRPQHPGALNNLGTVLAKLGRWPEAVECYRGALAHRPDFPDARRNLDTALRQLAPAPAAPGRRSREFMQQPFDCAVLVRTIMRPSLVAAIESVYAQDFRGRIQILVGVDQDRGRPEGLEALLHEKCPPNMGVTLIDPGYSTAKRNGGLYSSSAGGALLTAMAYLANAPRILVLDDDNRMCPDHVRRLVEAMGDKPWAFSLRWFVNPANGERIAVDRLESVGPDRGAFARKFGGFVDMNSWIVDKLKLHKALPALCLGPYKDGVGDDRVIFDVLRKLPFGETGEATSEYLISPQDQNHPVRLQWFAQQGYDIARLPVPARKPVPAPAAPARAS